LIKMRANRLWAVVAAAGVGQRMGGDAPKQYHTIAGRMVIDWSVAALLALRELTGLMLVHAPGDKRWQAADWATLASVHGCEGGRTRADSVLCGLRALRALGADDADSVLVHDAARPGVKLSDIRRLIEQVDGNPDGGLLAIPVRDTLKRAHATDCVSETLPREQLWQAMTPQLFPLGRLEQALSACAGAAITDESLAMERIGAKPRLIMGAPENIKYTYPADQAWLSFTLGKREQE
jgi:2-C-methyl-D-erythritol 4-phosphate cytidylyltransferase